jgi:hypothetical protein
MEQFVAAATNNGCTHNIKRNTAACQGAAAVILPQTPLQGEIFDV